MTTLQAATTKFESRKEMLEECFKEVENSLAITPPDLRTLKKKCTSLKRNLERTILASDNLIDLLLKEKPPVQADVTNAEKDQAKLSEKAEDLLLQLEEAIHKLEKPEDDSDKASVHSQSKELQHRLPKLELPRFSGEAREWLQFWGSFKSIHEDPQLSKEHKFQYLVNCMKGGSHAQEVVRSYPMTAANYDEAVTSLTERFGRDDMLVEVYVRDLITLIVENTRNREASFSTLYMRLSTQLRSLENLGVTKDKSAAILYPMVESTLSEDVFKAWERYRLQKFTGIKQTSEQHLGELMEFLKNEVEGSERLRLARTSFSSASLPVKKQEKNRSRPLVPTAASLVATEEKSHSSGCAFCGGKHASENCCKAISMTVDERKKLIQEKKRCFICLKPGHSAKNCKAIVKCISCHGKHWGILCPSLNKGPETEKKTKPKQSVDMCNQLQTKDVMLQTLYAYVHGRKAKKVVRLMFDSGSSKSYILRKTAGQVDLEKTGEDEIVHLLFGGMKTKARRHNRYRIHLSDLEETFFCNFEVSDELQITGDISTCNSEFWFQKLLEKGIKMEAHHLDKSLSTEVEVLIGCDIYAKLLTGKVIELEGGPVAIETRLGWTFSGKIPYESPPTSSESQELLAFHMADLQIKQLWDLDVIGITDPIKEKTRKEITTAALEFFKQTTTRNENGRYKVKLPFLELHTPLPSYRSIAAAKLKSTTARLEKQGVLEAYHQVIESWENEGIIEKVNCSSTAHYISHHGVLKPESTTTPVRPVFNASFKTKGNPSLNDCLEVGPNMLEQIPTVITRFRMGPVGITSDIRKAFLQIELVEEDRDFVRFLWYTDTNFNQVQDYRHCRVVFGVSSSPFLLAATLDQHLSNCQDFQETAAILKKSFYVDNCVASFQSEKAALKFKEESIALLQQAKMELREWEIGPSSEEKSVNILGMTWLTKRDLLCCDLAKTLKKLTTSATTRRKILSVAQSIFDPLGFVSPFTIIPKMILQETAKSKVGWDTVLPEELHQKFLAWCSQIPDIESVQLPRCIAKNQDRSTWSIHIFTDASSAAYSACAYLRSGTPGDVTVNLLMARTRVAPIKPLTIPRLELIGCLCGSRLANSVREMMELSETPVTFWTDSTTALAWIQHDKNWSVFVGNRVNDIRSLSNINDWRHVPGKLNPADVPSRGASIKTLVKSSWWEGPAWLKLEADEWPEAPVPEIKEEEINQELRKTVVAHYRGEANVILTTLNRRSDYFQIVRIVVYVKRFLQWIVDKHGSAKMRQAKIRTGTISHEEKERAEISLLKLVQRDHFPGNAKHSKLANTAVQEDEHGLLCVKTKLFPGATEGYNSPIVLPREEAIVQKLIWKVHWTQQHAGVRMLMTKLREKYWILGSMRVVNQVVRKCVKCRRYLARPLQAPEGPLPLDRQKFTRAFDVTGVDMAGPLYLKGNKKVWIAVFSCAVTRGLHLELVSGLTTEKFIAALRRFVARRGRPTTIYSDNGTNFVGTANFLKAVDWSKVEEFATCAEIRWKFNPPTASWWGGFWERMIGIIKPMLRAVLGSTRVTNEELETLLCDIESTINNRPLTYVMEGDDIVPLTPDLLIRNCGPSEVPDLDAVERNHLVARYRNVQAVREELRSRFYKEYLALLIHTAKKRKSRAVMVG